MTAKNSLILLLKSSDDENIQDPYTEELKKKDFKAFAISTLSFEFQDTEKLSKKLKNAEAYRGLILTSKRAVEAVALAGDHGTDKNSNSKENLLEKWRSKRIFVVGPATYSAAKQKLSLDGAGKECGSAEILANMIGQEVPDIDESRPLLFPCSSIKRDTLPKTLNEMGIPVECVTCYQTIPSPTLVDDISNFIRLNGFPGITVFFSPSGVKMALPVLRNAFDSINPNRGSTNKNTQFAAIGPTTASSLRESRGIWKRMDNDQSEKKSDKETLERDFCWCIANQPNPVGLCQAITEALSR